MNKVTIFGREDCERCALAKALIPGGRYRHHDDIFDQYDTDTALGIVEGSGGDLPIIVVEGRAGMLVLGPSNATRAACEGGACRIPTKEENDG
jgi:hypothetical protein